MGRIEGILILAFLLVGGLEIGEGKASDSDSDSYASVSACERIFEYFTYCLGFLTESPNDDEPSRRCCNHIEKLNILAKHRVGPRHICWCIQVRVKGHTPSLVPSRIYDLPYLCNTHLSFPISDSMDCSKV
ncbi:non-specific lipid-transfer protein 13-like [Senna tora]|uniref:Non-specific lipid-transfer protein 13-like n=1 Tax=Senna tora TaxID=362788 RepID=A0A834TJL2_9FABA|nr:non-specific lipid-transfer protein 13-like [Senna tora]